MASEIMYIFSGFVVKQTCQLFLSAFFDVVDLFDRSPNKKLILLVSVCVISNMQIFSKLLECVHYQQQQNSTIGSRKMMKKRFLQHFRFGMSCFSWRGLLLQWTKLPLNVLDVQCVRSTEINLFLDIKCKKAKIIDWQTT